MGLRCLIGHDYGEPLTERDREERGEEVVTTVREFKECSRCGHRQVISENTEVTTTKPTGPEQESTTPADVPEEPPETIPKEGGGVDSEYEDVSAEEDDGIILPDEEGKTEDVPEERQHGEWPDSESEREGSPEDDETNGTAGTAEETKEEGPDWPTHEADDEGFDAKPTDDEPVEDVEFGGGLKPERSEIQGTTDASDSESDSETVAPETGATASGASGTEATTASGLKSASAGPTPTEQQRKATPDAIVVCPNCDHRAPGTGTSLRPGDICPECQSGYLAEREE